VVTNGATFAAGDYAEIREDNDAAWGASTWAPKVVGQILRITAVAGNTLALERPLRITFLAAQNPEIRKIVPVAEAGIENIKISRVTAGTATDRDNKASVLFNYAARCWVRGVEFNNGFGSHISLDYSYYLNADPSVLPTTPAWWNIAGAFPSIGLPLTRTTAKELPARSRYFAGTVYTVAPPSLSQQPASKSLAAGQPVTFSVQAAGSPSAQFVWRKNGTPIATGSSLTITSTEREDAGLYDCVVSDDYGSVNTSAATLAVSDSFSAWSARKGVAGSSGDPDFDGLPNLVEYALGSDPQTKTPSASPVVAPDGDYLTLTYTKVKNSPDITCAAQVASSLAGAWDSSAASVDQLWQVIDNGSTETITARDKAPLSASPTRFMRLKITTP
jgi:hypothetical protein